MRRDAPFSEVYFLGERIYVAMNLSKMALREPRFKRRPDKHTFCNMFPNKLFGFFVKV